MAIMRVHKTKNYTVMSNYHFREKEMSLKAKGLLSQMLSLPDDWDYSIAGLVAINKENETSIKSTLNELKKFKYLTVTKLLPNETNSGRIEYVYDIFEQPYEKQDIEKQGVENLGVENQVQYNTNNINTKKQNTDNKKESKKETFDDLINKFIAPDGINVRFEDPSVIRDLLQEWLKVRKSKRTAMTNKAIELNLNKLDKLARESKMSVNEYLEEVIARGWAAFYKINNYDKTNASNNYKRQEIVPEWIDKDVKSTQATKEEQAEMNDLLKEFKEDDFEVRKLALQERLRSKYGKSANMH